MSERSVGWRLRHLHREERVIDAASRPLGQLAVFGLAALLVLPVNFGWERLAIATLALIQLAPELRNRLLALAGLGVLYWVSAGHWEWDPSGARLASLPMASSLVVAAALIASSWGVYRLGRDFARLPRLVRRYPQLLLHAMVWLVLIASPFVAGLDPRIAAVFAAAASLLPWLVWRLGYLILAARRRRRAAPQPRFEDHLLYLFPVFGGTGVPYGKGSDYLSRHAAADKEERARSQLAGLKLLVLMWLWQIALYAMDGLVHGNLDNPIRSALGVGFALPTMPALLEGGAASLPTRWLALLLELFRRVLELAVEGHLFVGLLRLYGFNVFRNTYKPLLAETLVDFWGRFHHYFKELLVEFFFFPTFLAVFRNRPRLRLFTATFAAACLGNLYFHILVAGNTLLSNDLETAFRMFAPRAVYSVLLAIGIYYSMLRQQARRGEVADAAGLPLRVRRIAGVWLFFALIHVWNQPADATLAERARFLMSLVGF